MAAYCILCEHSAIDNNGRCRLCSCHCAFKGQAPPVGRDFRITTEQGRFSAERLYTLKEIEELAGEYADGLETTDCSKLSVQLTLSAFLAHLKKQEKEVEG